MAGTAQRVAEVWHQWVLGSTARVCSVSVVLQSLQSFTTKYERSL